jgi:hypothetical protein
VARYGWIVGGLVTVGVLANQLTVPTPLWFSALGVSLVLLTTKLVARRAVPDQRVAL